MSYKRIYRSRAKNGLQLLRAVKRAILVEPARLNMLYWLAKLRGKPTIGEEFASKLAEPACGTVACVAGWTLLLGRKKGLTGNDWDAPMEAADLLVGNNPKAHHALAAPGGLFFQYDVPTGQPGDFAYAAYIAGLIDEYIAKHRGALESHNLR